VTMCSGLVRLMMLIREARVVDLPDPVGPVTRTSPFESQHMSRQAFGRPSFSAALKYALREDPDVILVGEMRDLETISTALTAAETGHLVFGTLHTQTASSTIDRVIDVFPPSQQQQVRIMIANSLQGVLTQTLLPTADGSGRVAALEILLPDDAVRNLVRQAKVEQLYTVMQTSSSRGMQTMEQALADLVLRQIVDYEEALARTTRVEQLLGVLERAGMVVGTGGVPIAGPIVNDTGPVNAGLRLASS